MKQFLSTLLGVVIVVLIAVAVIAIIANVNGLTIVEQIKDWFGIVSETSVPVVDPTKDISF